MREDTERLVPPPVVAVGGAPCTVAAGQRAELRVRLEVTVGVVRR